MPSVLMVKSDIVWITMMRTNIVITKYIMVLLTQKWSNQVWSCMISFISWCPNIHENVRLSLTFMRSIDSYHGYERYCKYIILAQTTTMYSFINITSPQQFSVLRFFGSGIDFYLNIKDVMKCGTLELFQKEKQLIPCLTLSVQALREMSKCRGGGY